MYIILSNLRLQDIYPLYEHIHMYMVDYIQFPLSECYVKVENISFGSGTR
jgi:hypothetical protein